MSFPISKRKLVKVPTSNPREIVKTSSIVTIDDIIDEVAGVYPRIMLDGDIDAGVWSCGMVAGLIDDVPGCQELIERIMSEADALINQRLSAMVNA